MYTASDFEQVQCYYTGGGIWVYSAKYKGYYLYGSLDQVLWAYTISGEDIETEHNCDYEKFAIEPAEYPTWGDVVRSLLDNLSGDPCLSEMIATIAHYCPDFSQRVCDYD